MNYMDRVRRLAMGLMAVGLTACGTGTVASSHNTESGATTTPTVMTIRMESDRIELTTPASMCRAELVVVATVRSLGPSRWNTPDGAGPAGDVRRAVQVLGYRIQTPFETSAQSVLLDHRSIATRQFVVIGGTAGNVSVEDDAYPQLASGHRYVIVLVPTIVGRTGKGAFDVLVAHNAFPVAQDGSVNLQARTIEQGRISQNSVSISIPDLTRQLRSC